MSHLRSTWIQPMLALLTAASILVVTALPAARAAHEPAPASYADWVRAQLPGAPSDAVETALETATNANSSSLSSFLEAFAAAYALEASAEASPPRVLSDQLPMRGALLRYVQRHLMQWTGTAAASLRLLPPSQASSLTSSQRLDVPSATPPQSQASVVVGSRIMSVVEGKTLVRSLCMLWSIWPMGP